MLIEEILSKISMQAPSFMLAIGIFILFWVSGTIFKTIVRNNSDFIKDSMYIPTPILKYIECYTPPGVMAISGAIDKKALQALNAGDIKSAIDDVLAEDVF